jgi:hypothetical protein
MNLIGVDGARRFGLRRLAGGGLDQSSHLGFFLNFETLFVDYC